jgi:PAS domain S-box-containing protein
MTDEPTHILLVEDDPAHAELVRRAFESRGRSVHLQVAETLAAARTRLAGSAELPGLIISDWRLPDGEGMELLQDDRLANTPVIIMTSQGNERVAVGALKAGARDYVVKSETALLDMPHIAERVLHEWEVRAERERMQQALRASEEKFNKAFRSSPVAMAISADMTHHYLEVNDAFVRLTGYPQEALLDHAAHDLGLWADLDEREYVLQQMAQQGFVHGHEVRLKNRNGEIRMVLLSLETVELKGAPCLLTTIHDITERRQAEDALRASEDRFRSLVQNSQDIITVHDRNGTVIYESPSVVRVFGYEPGYLIGKSPLEFILPEDVAEIKHAFEEVVNRQDRGLPIQFRFRRADDMFVYLEALGSNLLDHPGVRGIVITSRDVTERKRVERSLLQYTERLSILHEIDQAILAAKSIEDIADAALSRIQRSVPSWRAKVQLFDFEMAEAVVVAYYCDGIKQPTGERLPLAALGSIVNLRPGELYVINDLSELLDPTPRQQRQINDGAQASIDAPLIVLGQLIGVLGVDATRWDAFQGEVVDVVREVADQLAVAIQNARLLEQTQRHAHELEQRVAERTRELAAANERLTELDRLKSKFVSDVSHELRTPIANLKLHVELLENGRPEKHAHYLGVVKQQSRRLGQLVDDILNLSRLEMGHERLVFGPVDLNFVVEQIVAAHQPRAESSGLTLSFEPQPTLHSVRGEVNQLSQVVTNLLINALNYTSDGAVRVSTFQTATEACLQIEDTGIGIDPEDLPNIFARFYRGSRSQRSETPGTGLGLAIVKEIVDLHDGRIEVYSQVKQGTTFKVWLPLFCETSAA